MSKHKRRYRHNKVHGQFWPIATCLSKGALTLPELEEQFRAAIRRFGFFDQLYDQKKSPKDDFAQQLKIQLEDMIDRGWVKNRGEYYELTALGREEAEKAFSETSSALNKVRRLAEPEMVSKISLGVHLSLAALKFPAGLLSGSIGLINDAVDTLLDGLSSLLAYFGFRFNKEKIVNIVLVLLMLGTGGLTFYEAIRRFFVPFEPDADWFTFTAALFSALLCAGLWAYQRYVGLKSGSMVLITQSVDSRNHVIIAIGVTAGLIASLLRFSLLDTLVGLVVAFLILKSGIELAYELIRSIGEEEVDVSHYHFAITKHYDRFRQINLHNWILYLIDKKEVTTQDELIERTRQALDFSQNLILQELGLNRGSLDESVIKKSVEELYEKGWLAGEKGLKITEKGEMQLKRKMW